jgi:hypothetical protein
MPCFHVSGDLDQQHEPHIHGMLVRKLTPFLELRLHNAAKPQSRLPFQPMYILSNGTGCKMTARSCETASRDIAEPGPICNVFFEQDLEQSPKCSFFLSRDLNGMNGAKVTLLGDAETVDEKDRQSVRDLYLKKHPNAFWVSETLFLFNANVR